MPRLRKYSLILRAEYERSPATRLGLRLGRPRPARLISPPSINCSNTTLSCRSPGVSTYVIGLPLPSHLTCIFVEKPPLLLPNASSGRSTRSSNCSNSSNADFRSPFLPPLLPLALPWRFCGSFWHRKHVGEHGLQNYLQSVSPTQPDLWYQHLSVPQPTLCPKRLVHANDRTVRRQFSKNHTVQAYHARGHQSC